MEATQVGNIATAEYLLNMSEGLTKTQITEMTESAVNGVLERGNPIQVAEALKAMETFIEAVRKDQRFADYLNEELSKSSGKVQTTSGAKIEVCEVGTKYDYSNCADPVLNELTEGKKAAEAKVKEREAFLKTVPASGLNVITDDGEAVTVYPPSKTSTTSYKITLAK